MRCLDCARRACKEHESNQTSIEHLEESDRLSTRVRSFKRDDSLKDQQSTGRKRAARLYPLTDKPCEWSDASPENPKGGGDNPITVGCRDTQEQQARHHGPDKNTLNNDPGNVHRICIWHHIQWHLKNDSSYDPNKPLKS